MKVQFEGFVLRRRNITATGYCRNIVWITRNVAQDAVHGRALFNTVINLQISRKVDYFVARKRSWT
jgi:hypothetical protein